MTQTIKKHAFLRPILVLTVICLVTSVLLALTNAVTAPIIAATERAAAEAAKREVLPGADTFEVLQVAGLPETVTEADRAANGCGYVFLLTGAGYGGKDTLNLICGMDASGRITATRTLSHEETAGLGAKVAEDPFQSQFAGLDRAALDQADAISGATFSSHYYISAIRDAFTAYTLVKEAAQ